MRTRRLAVLVVLTTCVTALLAVSVSASVFLRTDPSGAVLPAGSLVETSNMSHISYFGMAAIDGCTTATTFVMTVGASGGPAVTATVKTWTINQCNDGMGTGSSTSCAQARTSTTTGVLTFSSPTDVRFDRLWLECRFSTPGSCYYKLSPGTATFGFASSIFLGEFSNSSITLTHSPPPGATDDRGASCGTDSTFHTTLTRLVVGGTSTPITVTAT